MFANNEIDSTLNKICEHKLFANSPRNIRLLKYLVKQALTGNQIKEQTIGIEVFNIDYNSEKTDSNVRVYMYKLRSKLNNYYKTDGANDSLIFEIKKGQYNLTFVSAKKFHEQNKLPQQASVQITVKTLKFSLVTLLLMVLGFFLVIGNLNNKNTYCWKPFFKNNESTLCIVADHFIIEQKSDPNIHKTLLLKDIHNEKDFVEYINSNNETTLFKADYTLLSKMAPFSIHHLSTLFNKNNSNFTICLESEFKYNEVKENNIVFIGQFKTMNTSKSIFLSNSTVFKTHLDGFSFIKNDSTIIYNTSYYDNKKVEYVMVSVMKLDSGKNALFFASNNDIGVMATVRNFTNLTWLNNFYKQLPENAQYFNALFEVSGVQRTDMNCKLIELEIIEP